MADQGLGPILRDPLLTMSADILNDLESVRVANENRLRILTTPADQSDKDGACRGHGLSPDHPDVRKLAALVEALQDAENQAVRNLQAAMRHHPLGYWVKQTVGVGEKQTARLIGSIGDPYWHDLENRARTLHELWSYCGWGDAKTQRRLRGQKSNWSADARKRTWCIADSCIKQAHSPYRSVYDQARDKYADATHEDNCAQCGVKGKPAQPGTPLRDGHKHARGYRAMCKEILRDIWIESKKIHDDRS